MRFRYRHDEVELVRLGLQRALGTAHIGHQRSVLYTRKTLDAAHHFVGIAHHGNGFRRCEGCHLDLGVTAFAERVDQRDLDVGRHKRRLVLEAVAGNDFIEVNA